MGDDERRATAGLLWTACRPCPDPAAVDAAVDAGADLRLAAGLSVAGRTAPLLWRALDAAGRLDDLGDNRGPLEAEYEMRRVQAAVLLPLVVPLAVGPLTAAGLEPVVHKGPAVAARYPSPGLRPMDDIDVLLPPEQHDQALGLLLDAGWTRYERGGHHHDTVLFHPSSPGLALELHRALESWRDEAHRLTSMRLWRARRPIDCLGTAAFGLPPEDEFVALAAHAGKPFHTFGRLIWSVDFAVVLEAAGDAFDWDAVARLADDTGCRTVVAVAGRHARRLGAAVPDDVLALPTGRYRRAALAPVVAEEWPAWPPDEGVHHRLRYALWDLRSRQLRLLAGEIATGGLLRTPQRIVHILALGVGRWRRWRRSVSDLDAPVGG